VPYLEHNYGYIVECTTTKEFFLVDPGDFVRTHEVMVHFNVEGTPKFILTTHKHWDHTGENYRFAEKYPGIKIYGGYQERVDHCTNELKDEEIV